MRGSTAIGKVDDVVVPLRKILQLYIEGGPESMETMTKSYLASPPTEDVASVVFSGWEFESKLLDYGAEDHVADVLRWDE